LQKRCLELKQDVSSLQEQSQVEMNLRVELEVQDEGWRLAIDEEINAIECNNTWELSYPFIGGQPINKNMVKNKLSTKIARNPVNNKSAKEKNKLVKERNRMTKEKIKLTMERVENKQTIVKEESSMKKMKNLTIHEREKHNVRRVIARGQRG